MTSRLRIAAAVVHAANALLAGVLLITLSGCIPAGVEGGTPDDPAASGTASATPTDSASGAPDDGSDVDTPAGAPVDVSCEQLLSAQAIYDFNPNFGLIGEFTPASGSLAATAAAENGLACRWVNQSSGETIDVSVANLPDARLAALASTAGSGDSVTGLGDEAYFGDGTLQAFASPYWVVLASPAFFEAADASTLAEAALSALG